MSKSNPTMSWDMWLKVMAIHGTVKNLRSKNWTEMLDVTEVAMFLGQTVEKMEECERKNTGPNVRHTHDGKSYYLMTEVCEFAFDQLMTKFITAIEEATVDKYNFPAADADAMAYDVVLEKRLQIIAEELRRHVIELESQVAERRARIRIATGKKPQKN